MIYNLRLFTMLIHNLIALRCFNMRVAWFLWCEFPLPIERSKHKNDDRMGFDHEGNPVRMVIGQHKSNLTMLTSLLHEVGHYRDMIGMPLKEFKKYDLNPKRFEKAAWKHAIRFSDKYGIPLDYKDAVESLETYETKYACLNNRLDA